MCMKSTDRVFSVKICFDFLIFLIEDSSVVCLTRISRCIVKLSNNDLRKEFVMEDKVVLITGSASGLGRRTAMEFAKKGAHVVINYRKSKKQAEILAHDIEKQFAVKSAAIQADITSSEQCKLMVHKALEKFGAIDILVNNGGPYVHERKTLIEYTEEEWDYVVNGNLNSVFYLCKEIVPKMRAKKWGRIINFGFERAETAPGWVNRSAFAAAKTGLVSLTKTLALEEAPYGITVNMVCPGDIRDEWKEQGISEALNQTGASAMPRNGTGEDVARVACFLAEDHSDYITGSVIPITGGNDVLSKSYQSYKNNFAVDGQ
jgi:3-oxoacyl-[acyl-carrier protein] reductase